MKREILRRQTFKRLATEKPSPLKRTEDQSPAPEWRVSTSLRHHAPTVLMVFVLSLMLLVALPAAAQEVTDEPVTPAAQTDPTVVSIQVNGGAPVAPPVVPTVVRGQSSIITINGTNFVPGMKVILLGEGELGVSQEGSTIIRTALPTDLIAGTYILEARYNNGVAEVPAINGAFQFRVIEPTAQPSPPTARPEPTQAPPPTDIPGAPNLIVRSFIASPATIKPGDTTTFVVELINQGTRPALGVSLTVDPGGKFIPANGQANIILPDLGVNGVYTVNLPVVAAQDTPDGPQTVTISMSYRDFTATTYSSKGTLTVNVQGIPTASQVTMARYRVDPNPVEPGKPATVTILLTNSGNRTAGQVLVQLGDGILLAGPEGNSFPVGDLEPGESASVDMPLIVNREAKAGPQAQTLTINYLQAGETKSINQGMTLEVVNVVAPAPLLLLDTFNYGDVTSLKPGERFTLTLTLKNIGEEDANNMQVTFGTVEGGNDLSTPTGSSTTPSSTFAPLGSGDTQFAGTLEKEDGEITLTQQFIVNGSVDSGIYSLPITLRYQTSNGTAAQTNLRGSIVVVVPPQIRVSLPAPLPETANVGEPIFLALEIANRGRKPVNFTNALVTAENGEVVEGEDTYLGSLRNDDQTSLNLSVSPQEAGPVKISVTFNYIDDLNQPQTLVEEYEFEAVEPEPMPDFNEPIPDFNQPPPTQEAPNPDEILGRILLGLLGLGS